MLAARFYVFNPILPLLAFIYFATADPQCDLTYGQPKYTDCLQVVDLLQKDIPGGVQNRRQLFFSLRGQEPPPWIPEPARVFRVAVPFFLRIG